jgi:predicted transcriptional regulator
MVTRDVLMSIRPEYAEAILSGSKTVELRRRRPSFPSGTRVIVYSSSPDQRLLGTFEAGAVRVAPPEELWVLVGERAGVARLAFDAYFAGCELGYAIEVCAPRRLEPEPLRFRPPQSYLFLQSRSRRHRAVLSWATG